MKIKNINSLKKHLCTAFSILLISCFVACKKDSSPNNNKDYLIKAKIGDADLLFNAQKVSQSYSSDFNETLLKQNKSGKIEPVYFVKENGDSITMNISIFRKLSNEFLLLEGSFSLKNGYFSRVLINTKTENIYGFPNDYNQYYGLYSSIEKDKNGNLYFREGSDMIYKINISSSDNVKIEEYIPMNQQPGIFMVNPSGICAYYSQSQSNGGVKFKLLSGSILTMANLFGSANWYNNLNGLFYGFDGDYYIPFRKDLGSEATLYRVNFDNDEPKLTPLITYDGESYNKNHVKKTYFAMTTIGTYPGPYERVFIEIDGTEGNKTYYPCDLLTLENTFYGMGLMTAKHYVIPALEANIITKISLSDYSSTHIELGSKSEYEFYDIKCDTTSDIISFTALRYRDGKNIIGSVDTNNNISMEVIEQGKPINLVKLN